MMMNFASGTVRATIVIVGSTLLTAVAAGITSWTGFSDEQAMGAGVIIGVLSALLGTLTWPATSRPQSP